jgi:hypothetical protein
VFKLSFKELWTREAIEGHPNLDVMVRLQETQSEFVSQTAESTVKLAKANGIMPEDAFIPQHLHVDSRYYVEWELYMM